RLSLPTYPFQRQRYWLPIKPAAGRFQSQPTSQHPLAMPGLQEHRFESEVSIAALPYLADHQVLGMVVVPATAYVEMALAAAAGSWGQGSYTVSDLTIHEALIVGAEES